MSINGQNSRSSKKQVSIDNTSFRFLLVLLAIIAVIIVVTIVYFTTVKLTSPSFMRNDPDLPNQDYPFRQEISVSISTDLEDTKKIDNVNSEFAALVDITDGEVVASKKLNSIIYPASLTKVMTLIVVYENLPSEEALDELLEIKYNYDEHSGFGFKIGEKLSVKDLIYAAILQSDGVACLTLADYIAGSEAAFVKLMNEKVRELGLLEGDAENNPSTKFMNCTGLHHDLHYTTGYDMSVIMAYAMKNDFCANVLTSLKHIPETEFRSGGPFTFWHNMLHKYFNDGNTQPKTATIMGGKTGWTGKDSGYCFVTYARGKDGHEYVTVTAKAETWSECTDDTLYILNNFID